MLSTLAGAQLPTRRQSQATQSSVPQTFAPRSRSVCGPASRCRLASGTHSPPPSCRACCRCRRLRPCGRALAVRAVMTAPPEGHTAGAHPCRDPYSLLKGPAPLCSSPLATGPHSPLLPPALATQRTRVLLVAASDAMGAVSLRGQGWSPILRLWEVAGVSPLSLTAAARHDTAGATPWRLSHFARVLALTHALCVASLHRRV